MKKIIFPNITLTHDISLKPLFSKNRTDGTTEAEYFFYWYCSLLQEDQEQSMMKCNNDEFLADAHTVMALSQHRLAHS